MSLDDKFLTPAGTTLILVDILDDGRLIFTNEEDTADVVLRQLPKAWVKI